MSNAFGVSELIRMAHQELEKRKNGKTFMLSDVCKKARKAYEMCPEDSVIRQFARVVEKMAEKRGNWSVISQKEMSDIYDSFVKISADSNFRDIIGDLVFDRPMEKKADQKNSFIESNRDYDKPLDIKYDQELKGTFDKFLSGDPKQSIDQRIINRGNEYVSKELVSMGFNDINVKFAAGTDKVLVYNVDFVTDKGMVTVAFPIEYSSGKLLFPSVFVADNVFQKISKNNISFFIDKKGFRKDYSFPSAKSVVATVEALIEKSQGKDVDIPDIKSNAQDTNTREKSNFDDILVSGDRFFYDNQKRDLPNELSHLTNNFEDGILESASSFGKEAVVAGKSIVIAELASAGFKGAQVSFSCEGGDSAIYLAKIATPRGVIEIEVPVDMKEVDENKYKPLLPSHFACDGIIEDFDSQKLQRFVLKYTTSSSNISCSSIHKYMSLPELREEMIKSLGSDDFVSCEMILDTIKERFNDQDYKNSFADYFNALSIRGSVKKPRRKCSREIPAGKLSIFPMCGHYNVTMDKVVVGEDGLCRLKKSIEREKMSRSEDATAHISSSKLIFS